MVAVIKHASIVFMHAQWAQFYAYKYVGKVSLFHLPYPYSCSVQSPWGHGRIQAWVDRLTKSWGWSWLWEAVCLS